MNTMEPNQVKPIVDVAHWCTENKEHFPWEVVRRRCACYRAQANLRSRTRVHRRHTKVPTTESRVGDPLAHSNEEMRDSGGASECASRAIPPSGHGMGAVASP